MPQDTFLLAMQHRGLPSDFPRRLLNELVGQGLVEIDGDQVRAMSNGAQWISKRQQWADLYGALRAPDLDSPSS